jgi:hypothetical protein
MITDAHGNQQVIIKRKIAKTANASGKVSPVIQPFTNTIPHKERGQSLDQGNPQTKKKVKEGKNCVRKFAFATRVGYHPNNPNKVNQDAYILAPNIQSLPSFHLFGICDGHGQFGREVSHFVKVALP